MTERLVFDGEKNENNELGSYFITFTLSLKCLVCRHVCLWLTSISRQSPTECLFLELCCYCLPFSEYSADFVAANKKTAGSQG